MKSTTEGGFSKRIQDCMLRKQLERDERIKTVVRDFHEFDMDPNDPVSHMRGLLYDELFRPTGTKEELELENASYFGGFVSGNKDINL